MTMLIRNFQRSVIFLFVISVSYLLSISRPSTKASVENKNWKIQLIASPVPSVKRYRVVDQSNQYISQYSVLERLADLNEDLSRQFRKDLRAVLRNQEEKAFFWETPGMTLQSSKAAPFEFVILPAPALVNTQPTPEVFRDKFNLSDATAEFGVFPNLSGDAILIVPRPSKLDYSHFGAFLRHAPSKEVEELLYLIGKVALSRLSEKPVWISTCGTGVSWLHVRFDESPKYYSYSEFKTLV